MAERRALVNINGGVKELPSGDVVQGAWRTGDTKSSLVAGSQDGWLMMNGDTLGNSVSGADQASDDYATLFGVLRDLYPNAGTENFGSGDTVVIPDALGRVLVGAEIATDHDAGEVGGVDAVTLTEADIPAHSHDAFADTASFDKIAANGDYITMFDGNAGAAVAATSPGPIITLNSGSIGDTGAGGAHENRQRYLAVYHLIKI